MNRYPKYVYAIAIALLVLMVIGAFFIEVVKAVVFLAGLSFTVLLLGAVSVLVWERWERWKNSP
jgi:hypothetical protein